MNTRTHFKYGERGGILLTAVVIGGVLGIAIVAALSLSSFHNQTTVRSGVWNKALVVAEAGVEEAMAQLNRSSGTWNANGWTLSGGQYSKKRSLGSDWYLITITTNTAAPVVVSTASVFLPTKSNRLARAVRVNTEAKNSGIGGMVARGKVLVSGSVRTDSFDSSNPAYSTGGLYDPAKAKDNGSLGTISTDPLSFELSGSAVVNGKIKTGSSAGLKIGSSAVAGSIAWTSDHANAGTAQPGWHITDFSGSFTNISFPTAAGTSTPGSGKVGGTTYDYVLGSDKYWLGSLGLSGAETIMVTGNATLIIDDTLRIGGSAGFHIAPGAKLTLYVRKSATVGGRGILNGTGNPANFTYYGGTENVLINYSGTADFVGTIYAPNARMELSGSSQFIGASFSNEIMLGGSFDYHYDEALGGGGGALIYQVTSWDEL